MGLKGWCEGAAGLGLAGDSKDLALPGSLSPVQGAAWKILSEFKSLLLSDLQCDLGKGFHVSVSSSVKWENSIAQRDQR